MTIEIKVIDSCTLAIFIDGTMRSGYIYIYTNSVCYEIEGNEAYGDSFDIRDLRLMVDKMHEMDIYIKELRTLESLTDDEIKSAVIGKFAEVRL